MSDKSLLADTVAGLASADLSPFAGERSPGDQPLWRRLRELGTELWLDTGDLAAVEENWDAGFTALTTNNSLLNTEVQRGTYDELVGSAAAQLRELVDDRRQLIHELGFLLNCRHALRLVATFDRRVSVELHTDLADDLEGSLFYARRVHALDPEHLIVKLPLTLAGVLATRRLAEEGIAVNHTLGFSARQNHLVAQLGQPAYVNVFLGRIGGFVEQNDLGSPEGIGEAATLASQQTVRQISAARRQRPTRQIAASLRGASNLADLAGVDVYTMPPKVAAAGVKELDPADLLDRSRQTPAPLDLKEPKQWRAEVFTTVSPALRACCQRLAAEPPATPAALQEALRQAGCADLFPDFNVTERGAIADDGKIPDYRRWRPAIEHGRAAPDSLLNLAGLAAFAADQAALDARIEEHI